MPLVGSVAMPTGVTVAMLDDVDEAAFATTTRYWVGAVGVTATDEEVAPAIFTQFVPSNDCHWYELAPLAVTVRVAEPPGQTGWDCGCCVMSGPTVTPTCA